MLSPPLTFPYVSKALSILTLLVLTKHSTGITLRVARDFPGGPVVKILHFRCRGEGSPPGQGTKILQSQKKKKAAPRQRGQAEFKKKKKGEKKKETAATQLWQI